MNHNPIPIKSIIEVGHDDDPYVPIRIAPDRLRSADLSKLPRNLVLQTTVDVTTIHIRHIGETLDVELITAWAFNVPNRFQYLKVLLAVIRQVAHTIGDTTLPKLYVSEPDEEGNLSLAFRLPLKTPGHELLVIADRVFKQIMEDTHRTLDVIANSATPSAPIIDMIE